MCVVFGWQINGVYLNKRSKNFKKVLNFWYLNKNRIGTNKIMKLLHNKINK